MKNKIIYIIIHVFNIKILHDLQVGDQSGFCPTFFFLLKKLNWEIERLQEQREDKNNSHSKTRLARGKWLDSG